MSRTRVPSQAQREFRASQEFSRYQFRATVIAGHRAVYVLSPTGQVYTVPVDDRRARCNCSDSLHSCRGTNVVCKHTIMATRWLQEETGRKLVEQATITQDDPFFEPDAPTTPQPPQRDEPDWAALAEVEEATEPAPRRRISAEQMAADWPE